MRKAHDKPETGHRSATGNMSHRPEHISAAGPTLNAIVYAMGILSLAAILGGILGIVWNAYAPTEMQIFGVTVTTSHVGVAFTALGLICMVLVVRRVLKSVDRFAPLPVSNHPQSSEEVSEKAPRLPVPSDTGRSQVAVLSAAAGGSVVVQIQGDRNRVEGHPVVVGTIHTQTLSMGTPPAPGGADEPLAPLPVPAAGHCFGRDGEVATLVSELLADKPGPIVVLGGPGIGKTTIALTALRDPRVKALYGDRLFFVRCDGARTRPELAMEMGRAMGLPPSPQVEAASLTMLSRSRAVLVLDNAETPLDADSHAVEDLLGLLAGIDALALVCTLRGTTQPAAGLIHWRCVRPWALGLDAAKEAFLAIAGQQFAQDPHLSDVLGVTGRVPLVITLLARVAEGQPDLDFVWRRWQEVGTKLARSSGGAHRLDNLDISYALSIDGPRMSDPARRLLSLLGALPSGVALKDIAAVLPDVGEEAAHTLRQVGLAFDETDRLRVLAPLREHLQRNRQPGDDDRKRVVRHYCELAAVEGKKVGAAGGAQAVQRLAPEAANIETMALQVLRDGDVLMAASAVLGWGEFACFSGVGEAKLLLEVASTAKARGLVAHCAACTKKAGDIALRRSDHAAARARYEEALPLFRQVGNVLGEANCIKSLGNIALRRSDHAAARARYEEALPLYRRVGDVLGEANCIKSLGDIAIARSDHGAARARYEEALPLYRRVGAVLGEANCIQRLGDIALARSDHAAARARYEEALALYERIEEPYSIGRSHQRLAGLASDSEERKRHIGAAREAWTRIDRPDLVAELPKEFGDAAAGP